MIFILLFSSFLLSLLSVWYFLYFKPKKNIQKFVKDAQKLGYKVKTMPYQFMGYYMIKYMNQDDKSMKIFKQEFPKYDLIVGNHLKSLSIVPLDLQMLKDFFNQLNKLPKHPYVTQIFQTLSTGGTPFTQGNIWKRKRKIISSVFHFDFLNQMIPVIKQETNKKMKKINECIDQNKSIDIQKIFIQILSSVIAKCFFGTNMQEYQIQGKPYSEFYVEYLDDLTDYLQSLQYLLIRMKSFKYGLTQTGRNLKKRYNILYAIAKQLTENQLNRVKNKTQTKKNLVNLLYNSGVFEDLHKQKSQKYGVQDLVGEFFAFFAAGTDTTACALNLIFHYLSQNQNLIYVQKMRQELKEIKKMNLSEIQQYKNMKWIQAVFNQAIRLNGPAPGLFNRIASQNITLGPLKITKGTQISVYTMINNYKQKYFPNPNKFQPQRWINNTNMIPYSYIPFGAGQRNCIGQYLSRLQAKIVLSTFIQQYDIKAIDSLKMKFGFVYRNQNSIFQFKYHDKN